MIKKITFIIALVFVISSCSSIQPTINHLTHHKATTVRDFDPLPETELAMPKTDWSPNQSNSANTLKNSRLRNELHTINRSSFDAIQSDIPSTIKILGGQTKNAVAIRGDASFVNNVELKILKKTLFIQAINPKKTIALNAKKDSNIIYINLNQLTKLNSLGTENIIGQNISGGRIVISKTGPGTLFLSGYLSIRQLNLGRKVTTLIKGMHSNNLNFIDNDNSDVSLYGDIDIKHLNKNSTGTLNINSLTSSGLMVNNSGNGAIMINSSGAAVSLINNNGYSHFTMTGVHGDHLVIKSNGHGKIVLSGNVKSLHKIMTGGTMVNVKELRVG